MKICKLIFSTNRLKYLIRTLDSFRNLDFGNNEVYGIFIDDYPEGRDDSLIKTIAEHYGYDKVILHEQNQGLTATWKEAYEIISQMDFDYVWHQEDDVELLYPLHIETCTNLLKLDPNMVQVSLKRQIWYWHEQPVLLENDDLVYETNFNHYRYNVKQQYFWTMASCYPHWITKEPIEQSTGHQPSEGVVMTYLVNKMNGYSAVLKCLDGSPIVSHIGEVTKGRRISKQGDPSWDIFVWMDPNKRYCAKTGKELAGED